MGVFFLSIVRAAEGVLEISLRASVVIGLVLLVQWLFQKWLSPRWRYILWLVVLVRLILPVSPQSPLSIFNYTDAVKEALVRRGTLDVSNREQTAAQGTPSLPMVDTELAKTSADGNSVIESGNGASLSGSTGAETPISGGEPSGERLVGTAGSATLPALYLWLTAIWVIGAFFLAARILWFPLRLNAQMAQEETPTGPDVFKILEASKRLIGVNRVLPVVQSRAVTSPALFGFIRPWLLLPDGLVEKLSPRELHFVFLHELAHLKRRDIAVNWLMTLVQILHWFNPMVWFAFDRMRADRELACDELALSHAQDSDQRAYGETIIRLLDGFNPPARIAGLVGILEDKRQMKRRIEMIGQYKRRTGFARIAPVLLLALGLTSLTGSQTQDLENSAEPSVPRISSEFTLRKLADLGDDFRFSIADISSDGRYILGNIIVGDSGRATLPMVIDIVSGSKRRFDITDVPPGTPVAWQFSADGKQIVCARLWEHGSNATKELLLLDVETGTIRQMYRNEDLHTMWIRDWSSDGQTILAHFVKERGGRREIAVISVSDGTARELTGSNPDNFPGRIGSCAFSPDGRWIVYDVRQEGSRTADIRLMATDGSHDIALVEHPADDSLLGWPPSSDQIVFMSDRRGSRDAYTIQVADGKPIGDPVLLREIGRGILSIRFTRSGAFFFEKRTTTRDVYFADIDPSSGIILSKPRKAALIEGRNKYPAWSRDGRFLAYIPNNGPGGVIGIRNTQDGTVREIKSDTARFAFPLWSLDGRSIFALSIASGKGLVYRINVDSGRATIIKSGVSLVGNAWPWWSWSPDGKSFYLGGHRAEFTNFDLETGSEREIQISHSRGSTVLSPDCTQVVRSIVKRNEAGTVTRTISVLPVSGGEPRRLLELFGPEAIEEIHLYRSLDDALCWTPDGRYVVFVKANKNNLSLRSLWRVPVAGGEPEDLGLEMEKLRQPVISADGRKIAFTAGGSKTEVWVMENFLQNGHVASK